MKGNVYLQIKSMKAFHIWRKRTKLSQNLRRYLSCGST